MTQVRVLPPVLLLVALACMLGLHFALPGPVWATMPWRLGGGAVAIGGLGLTVFASELFRRRGTAVKPFRESSVLVVDGPYRFTRNPMYLGMTLDLAGVALALGSTTPLLVVPAFLLLIETCFVRAEEQMLATRFGQEYAAYRLRVRRWL